MHALLGSNSGLKRTGRPGDSPADPVPCGIMTQHTEPDNDIEQATQRWPSADDVALVGTDVTDPEER